MSMLKPEKRKELLAFLATETSLAKLDSKSREQLDNPQMEEKLFDYPFCFVLDSYSFNIVL